MGTASLSERIFVFFKRYSWLIVLAGISCAGSANQGGQPVGMLAAGLGAGSYNKKVAVLPGILPANAVGRQAAAVYLDQLIETMRRKDSRLLLITGKDPELEAFRSFYDTGGLAMENNVALSELARSQGLQGVLIASLTEVEPAAEKSNFLWIKRTRYSVRFGAVLDLFDPYTGAKLLSRVVERRSGISASEYENLTQPGAQFSGNLDKAIADIAGELGEAVAAVLGSHPWEVMVAEVQDSRTLLPAGRRQGLEAGGRLAVYKIKRVFEGVAGEKFDLPSERIGELRITSVGERSSEAVIEEGQGQVSAGDIAAAIK